MPSKYVDAPAAIAECVQCGYCGKMYPVLEGDEPRQSPCKRCQAPMQTEGIAEFAEARAEESAKALGMDVVVRNTRAIKGLMDVGFTEDEATSIIAAKAKADAAEPEESAKATKGQAAKGSGNS